MKNACIWISAALWLLCSWVPLHASFQEACGPNFKVGTLATTTKEIYATVCPFNLNENEVVRKLAGNVANILRSIPEDKPILISDLSPEFKSTLKPALDHLTTALNQINVDTSAAPSNDLEGLIYEFIRRFGTIEERRQHFEEYKSMLHDIISQTEIGREMISCFFKEHPDISSIDVFSSESRPGVSVFTLKDDPEHPGKYKKYISLDLNFDPINMIDTYLHEMKHGCDIDNKIAMAREKKGLKGEQNILDRNNKTQMASFRERVQNFNRKDTQYNISDELRAYQAQSIMREEMTTRVPKVYCHWLSAAQLWGYALNTPAQAGALMQGMINEGTFAPHLIDLYAKLGATHKEDIYDHQGIFLPEFRQKIEEAGFKLK